MIRLLAILATVITIYAFVECAIIPQEKVRRFPKWAWLLIIVFTGGIFVGSIAWFIAGRPKRPGKGRGGPRKIIPPDDDPDFLRKL